MTLYRRALGGPVAVLLFFGAETYPPRVPSVLVAFDGPGIFPVG
jgi:hypothetical protein